MEKASPFPSEIGDAFWKGSENVPTLRFTLSLPESDDKTCPEYSFLDLVKSATRKSSDTPEKTPWDDGDGDDEKLKALAKKFEQKYAPKPRSKKRRRDRVEDLIDVTYGYDDTDPFVDDTEAYDELLPADWTTEHGGFYINQGVLNFRPASPGGESEDENFQKTKKVKLKSPKKIPKVPKVKKVKVPSEKKERKKSGDKEKKPRKSSSGEKDKEKKHKKRISLGSANIANLLSSPSSSTKNSSAATTPLNTTSAPTVSSQGTSNVVANHSSPAKLQNSSLLSNHGTVKTEPSVSAMANGSSGAITAEHATVTQADTSVNSSLPNGTQSGEASSSEITEPTLPQCLPADVESCILRLKQAGNDGSAEGKCKFFNSDVNHMLLELETKSRALSSKVRTGIYEFLAFYLPCTKETLLKRAKNLLLNDQAGRLREPMAKLKAAVDRVIPEQIKRFEEEVKRHVEEESQKQSCLKQDGENPDDHKKELFKSAMEVVEDSEKGDEITTPTDPNAPTQPEDKATKNRPKRKFIWTDELRELLCDVVHMKMKIFQMSKTRAQSAEEYLKHFFENEVRPLWPKGWMTSRVLLKESKQAHGKYTSIPARVNKKVSAPGPKKQGESPENQDSNTGHPDLPSNTSAVSSISSTCLTTAIPALPGATATPAISALKNLAQSSQYTHNKPTTSVVQASVTVHKPIVTSAIATKMESTAVNRTELKLQAVPLITDLNLVKKDTSKGSVKPPMVLDSLKSKPAVTILDFADMISPEVQGDTSNLLHSQQPIPPKQQLVSFLNKTPSPTKEKPRDQPLSHLPSSVVTTTISLPVQSTSISAARTQTAMTSPPKVVRSSPATIQSAGQSALLAATVGNLTAAGFSNNFIDLASMRQQSAVDLASSMMQQQQLQQQTSAVDLASAMRQQQQKAVVTSATPSPSKTNVDNITSPRRPSVDPKSCQAVLPGFTSHQVMSPPSIMMSLNSAMPSQPMHQPQPPNLTLFGSAANLQGKVTTPLTHIGIAPHALQSAMLHLTRQTQEQSGIVLPQNHFNQVLLGMNPTGNQSLPSLQLSHAALLSNQSVYQDPNQTSTSSGGTRPSPFLPRFS